MSIEEKFMTRAIELAYMADASVQPNPYVGAVIVKNNKIIGEGFHKYFGGEHAEVIAIKNSKSSVEGADLYVTLEPCCHYGKTPPCTDFIIKNKIKRVYIATVDPNSVVCGNGIKQLNESGIETHIGICEKKSQKLNKIFFKNVLKKEPYIILKYAMTLDGYIATSSGNSKWISNEISREYTHNIRHNIQGILVGSGTLIKDNPSLSARKIKNSFQPRPIVLDFYGELNSFNFKAFRKGSILITSNKNMVEKDINIHYLDNDKNKHPSQIKEILIKEGIHSLLVEGGAKTLSFFIKNSLFDEVNIFIAPILLGGGISPTGGFGVNTIAEGIKLNHIVHHSFGDDIMIEGYNKDVYWLN